MTIHQVRADCKRARPLRKLHAGTCAGTTEQPGSTRREGTFQRVLSVPLAAQLVPAPLPVLCLAAPLHCHYKAFSKAVMERSWRYSSALWQSSGTLSHALGLYVFLPVS